MKPLAPLLTALSFVPFSLAAELTIYSTTDIHSYIYNYDYYSGKDTKYGLAVVASLLEADRPPAGAVLLVDNGDLIQGTPLASYYAQEAPQEPHPTIAAMNALGFQAGSLGNHEFNYGLPFLHKVITEANYPMLSANIYLPGTEQPYFSPYVILQTQLEGRPLKVGLIGFTPPQILVWDRSRLEGQLETGDIVAAAQRFVPEMRERGADIVVALAHTGADPEAGPGAENSAYRLAQEVPGIDVIVVGHSHRRIPGDSLEAAPDGILNGVALVQPAFHGRALGKVSLELTPSGETWSVTSKTVALLEAENAQPDPEILDLTAPAHQATLAYLKTPLGTTSLPLSSQAARISETPLIQLIHDAQLDYARRELAGTPAANLPLLSAAAPFKTGFGGPDDYTEIPAGPLTLADAGAIYVFDNTLTVIEVNGAELKGWLERAAENFNQVTPGAPVQLLNPEFAGYNFDQIEGVNYTYDLTQPVGQRVVELSYQGQPVKPEDRFALVTNNYRAGGGGNFPGTGDAARILLDPLVESREVIADYVRTQSQVAPQADHNWQLTPNFLAGEAAPNIYTLIKSGIWSESEINPAAPMTPQTWQSWVTQAQALYGFTLPATSPKTYGEAAALLAPFLNSK